MMTSFDYKYQNAFPAIFVMQICVTWLGNGFCGVTQDGPTLMVP